MANVLVTGGAGYIGSHAIRVLADHGYRVYVVDDLSSGNRWTVPEGVVLVEKSCGDLDALRSNFENIDLEAVIHFAGNADVEWSSREPLDVFENNTFSTLQLLRFCDEKSIDRFIFSSTAAIYGQGTGRPALESDPPQPISPYGHSKWAAEKIIESYAKATSSFSYVLLRYFNVAGAMPNASLGQATPKATHLIKVVCEAAMGLRDEVCIYGNQFDTPDGTGVRDYIHVLDLVNAHLLCLKELEKKPLRRLYNCGYGRGHSVLEVIDTIEKLGGFKIKKRIVPPRENDPGQLIAGNARILRELSWKPEFDNLESICETALKWEEKLLERNS